jgi:hypothetical protein
LLIGTDPDPRVVDYIEDLGFSVVNEIHLLGFTINKHGINVEKMYNKVHRNIGNIIATWSRYRLSLAGRIGIYKNLCLSQLSFAGSICSPGSEKLQAIQNLMNSFVTGNLKISRDKLYRDPDDGGIALINLSSFIAGLQCVWIKRADVSSHDNWRVDLRSRTYGNCLLFNPRLVKNTDSQPFRDLALSMDRFKKAFYNMNSNFSESYILENSLMTRGPNGTGILTELFFQLMC